MQSRGVWLTADDGFAHHGQLKELWRDSLLQCICQAFPVCLRRQRRWPPRARSEITYDQGQFFQVACALLSLDSVQLLSDILLCLGCRLLVDNDLHDALIREVTMEALQPTRLIDSEIRRHDNPILIAVSCLSPVSTQTLMPAC